jgi:myb proto-oncogene protein
MGRKPCCPKEGLNRGAWTSMEDGILVSYIQKHGEGKWGSLPRRAGLSLLSLALSLLWKHMFVQLNSALMSVQISVPPSLFG